MILFVHGMGSFERDFWLEWAGSLLPELAAQGLPLEVEDCGGVYYGDLVPHFENAGEIANFKERLKGAAMSEFKSQMGSFSDASILEKWVEAVVDNFGDIYAYLYLADIHRAVNSRLYEAIAQARLPATLIGNSLGSLVSYCALSENIEAAGQVGHLILVGSPIFWFAAGVAKYVDFNKRPGVRRFTNIAGILDIAWPQMVPDIIPILDETVSFVIDPLNPIAGHQMYFNQQKSLSLVASAVLKGWDAAEEPSPATSNCRLSKIFSGLIECLRNILKH